MTLSAVLKSMKFSGVLELFPLGFSFKEDLLEINF